MKRAILNVADTGPLESLVVMLRTVGYDCYLPRRDVKQKLRDERCNLVLDIDDLVRGMGYEHPFPLPEAGLSDIEKCDLFVDLKAHRNYHKIVNCFPSLAGKVLWYRINGGKPEHVIKSSGEDCGDEINPPCPILTPDLWYRAGERGCSGVRTNWQEIAYAMWPPFYRFDEYLPVHGRASSSDPICLIHNLTGWGYGALIENMQKLGIKCYGDGSPNGLIQHRMIPQMLSTALCMVHLKSSDAPGYALYEALAAACPVVCTRRLIWRNRMEELLIPGETCLVFDRETHDGLSQTDVANCTNEVCNALQKLEDPQENKRIGENGRAKLEEIMWDEDKETDVDSLAQFMKRNFS